ncbi:hypothetical protein COBT_001324, partial [Conglomerata obtusa]
MSHMATAAKQSVQENTVWQVPEEILEEMRRLENRRIELGIFGLNGRRIFERENASKGLLNCLRKQMLLRVPWSRIIGWNDAYLEEKRKEVLREKVMRWREKEIKEHLWTIQKSSDVKNGRYWKAICNLCKKRGHRIKDCYYTYNRVLERMEMKEKETKKKRLENFNPKIETFYNQEKRKKVMVVEKEALLDVYKDV